MTLGVAGVFCDGDGLPGAAVVVETLDSWKLHSDDLLPRLLHPLDGVPAVGGGVAVPGCAASSQDTFNDAVVEVRKCLGAHVPSSASFSESRGVVLPSLGWHPCCVQVVSHNKSTGELLRHPRVVHLKHFLF